MKNILFISRYPNELDLRDGMMQRIANVDSSFNDLERTYLYLSIKRNSVYSKHTNENLTIVKANIFLHIYKIFKFIKSSELIYIHSLWNYICLFFFNLKNKKVVLDVHGVVPEELEFYDKKFLSRVFSFFEKKLIRNVNVMIYVNNSMKNYYISKYPVLLERENYVCPILSKNVFGATNDFDVDKFRKELGILKDDVVFVYSGNIQKWQNFNLVVESIATLNNEKYKFIILTNDIVEVNHILESELQKSKMDRISILSVTPEELYCYYSISHYGYVLRDDHILNRSATPTKMIEYLYFGIIPIVKLIDIGDFNSLGYEYLSMNDVNDHLKQRKSIVNESIITDLILASYNIRELIL